MKTNIKARFKVSIVIVLSFLGLAASAQSNWEVPAEAKKNNATFKFDAASQAKGKEIYNTNCMSCHGTPTKKDYAQLTPLPGDVSEARFKNQTDGALFHKITEGRGLMLSFKKTLTKKQRWQVISYIRTFHEGYKQIVQFVDPATQSTIVMKLKQEEGEFFSATAVKVLNEDTTIAKGVELAIYLKRHFADMQIAENIVTDKNGYARFKVSKELKSDREGNVELIAKAPEFEGSEARAKFAYGAVNDRPSLIKERAFWNRPNKAPIPLQLLYFGGLFFFLAIAGYVVMQLLKMKKEA